MIPRYPGGAPTGEFSNNRGPIEAQIDNLIEGGLVTPDDLHNRSTGGSRPLLSGEELVSLGLPSAREIDVMAVVEVPAQTAGTPVELMVLRYPHAGLMEAAVVEKNTALGILQDLRSMMVEVKMGLQQAALTTMRPEPGTYKMKKLGRGATSKGEPRIGAELFHDNNEISRTHLQISMDYQGYVEIGDCSTNGTRVTCVPNDPARPAPSSQTWG